MNTIDVVLPVLNEVGAIGWVLDRMPPTCRPIVVENGSSDGSAQRAASFGAHVVYAAEQGFGAACHVGLMAAATDLVAFMDCDGSLDPSEIPRLAAPVQRGDADLVLGARRPVRGAWPFGARLANRGLSALLKRRGIDLSDLGPMRVTNRRALIDLDLRDRSTGWPLEMVLRADVAGWTITELPVPYLVRIGDSKVTGTVAGCVGVARQMRRTLRDVPVG